jgi:hypothetical protein
MTHMYRVCGLIGLTLALVTTGCAMLYLVTPSGQVEWARYEQELREYEQWVANLPSLNVRIVNDASAEARIVLATGTTPPVPPVTISEFPPYFVFTDENDQSVVTTDSQDVRVEGGQTKTTGLKCGDVIGVSVMVPYDPDYGGWPYVLGLGLSVEPGTIALTGTGTAGSSDLARFIQPSADTVDCNSATLVITITQSATTTYAGTITIE